ncbi:MAG: hypothetical protein D8M57_14145 [Candidatus Scalindua sp. AMX11]|nr:MAG: hypothetical protein DWQ00_09420 [Candidatus Scalindua sp.]NOG83569.1 DnaJ domain-containing protein [Planctomycetota bacterium]RZV70928.1 MAG: hypothetical protein EX341_15100 [Candidatus Scalindua sp. SCAELEC01]TDE64234.1 MAG: hypothetical protein D8M57_14145 [Candidatus Scalindua sp. AMX11]GJQ59972.1 MAG: hypothetical protein SCALA701_27730 [Candidatus Scalindua sp.]
MKEVSKLINYYHILQVEEGAKDEEIKNSFRKLVKEYHPDRHMTTGVCADEKIKLLIEAYKTLTDTGKKNLYDSLLSATKTARDTRHRYTSEKDTSSTGFLVRQILNDLLNKKGAQAIKSYERLRSANKECDLLVLLGLKDYVDCMFLLAEEYERQGAYELSFKWYEHVYTKAEKNLARKHLRGEIKERIIRLSCKNLFKSVQPNSAITYFKKVLALELNKNEEALVYKKIADCYLTLGDWNGSMVNFNKALTIYPNLKGTQKLRKKLHDHFLKKNISHKFAPFQYAQSSS